MTLEQKIAAHDWNAQPDDFAAQNERLLILREISKESPLIIIFLLERCSPEAQSIIMAYLQRQK